MPDGRWFEESRSKSRDSAYQIMRALAVANPRRLFVLVQCTLVGKDGREKAVVCFPGSETSILQERARRIAPGWDTPASENEAKEQLT
jgi:hypothetical protein